MTALSRVEVQQTPGTHHLTLSTLGLLPGSKIEHDRYDCAELYGDSSLMEDPIMFYGNQGDVEPIVQLPEGVAATIPAGLEVIYEMHYLNVTGKPVEKHVARLLKPAMGFSGIPSCQGDPGRRPAHRDSPSFVSPFVKSLICGRMERNLRTPTRVNWMTTTSTLQPAIRTT